ncbi:capsule biosynthesis GfcC family protein [Vibrio vulnificus]|uniref:capsule biosynthesis GfcC family protein n=1 Tax=Vibrio vulnificus TaxID=672 RepID=UPI001022D63E|nr:capsule biosynthesis GfcC family protein [Vibrio vulnificus]ELH4810938.1 capsule biosynthesis GfcC family protein [Vibrio vulnificus]MCU8551974.1 capsule biosynthesis GfcC family protein [Vibrio vulnificus]RZQ32740.1 polysaccharide synthesis protein [Vibrio vulnificus]HAS8589953.1 polysaccharide synthesis protein [Vibrio vulnificus]HAS8608619.1 polysaccharide synthesis protein [Vibrio vulnificus]
MKNGFSFVTLLSGIVASALTLSPSVLAASQAVDIQQPTQVILLNHGLQLNYPQPVRLEQVLWDAQQQNRQQNDSSNAQALSFHEGFQLFNLNKQAEADTLLQNVRQQLLELAKNEDYRRASQLLLTLVEKYQYGYREDINLDIDAVRLKTDLNPALPGHYALKQASRENKVFLLGLIDPKTVPFSADLDVADYITTSTLNNNGNKSEAWVIAPNGNSRKVGYSYWNNQHMSVLPGSTIFIGFNSSNDELQALESDIVKLLGMIKG